jgi:hypothetical protein
MIRGHVSAPPPSKISMNLLARGYKNFLVPSRSHSISRDDLTHWRANLKGTYQGVFVRLPHEISLVLRLLVTERALCAPR